jgi:Zn-dependent protease
MLISSIILLPDDVGAFIRLAVLCAIAAFCAIWVNGWFQAVLATIFGDPAPRAQGRLLGNPLRHLSAAGFVLATVSGLGWGRQLPGAPGRQGRGPSVIVSAAGPLGNLTVAFLLAAPVKAGLLTWTYPSPDGLNLVMTGGLRSGLSDVLGLLVIYNLLHAVFHLLPLAPLAGYRVLAALLPAGTAETHQRFQRYAPLLLAVLIASDYVLRPGILWATILPTASWLAGLATGY